MKCHFSKYNITKILISIQSLNKKKIALNICALNIKKILE